MYTYQEWLISKTRNGLGTRTRAEDEESYLQVSNLHAFTQYEQI